MSKQSKQTKQTKQPFHQLPDDLRDVIRTAGEGMIREGDKSLGQISEALGAVYTVNISRSTVNKWKQALESTVKKVTTPVDREETVHSVFTAAEVTGGETTLKSQTRGLLKKQLDAWERNPERIPSNQLVQIAKLALTESEQQDTDIIINYYLSSKYKEQEAPSSLQPT